MDQTIQISINLNANGQVDQNLLKHLEGQVEAFIRESFAWGNMTPNDPESLEKYSDTSLILNDVNAHVVPDVPVRHRTEHTGVLLAALRNLQSAIFFEEDLSRFDDIVDFKKIDCLKIDSICEQINMGDNSEAYHAIKLSTSHLEQGDIEALTYAAEQRDPKVQKRPTGFFLKVYNNSSNIEHREWCSDTIKGIVDWAYLEGFRLIEFDSDADELAHFPVFEH